VDTAAENTHRNRVAVEIYSVENNAQQRILHTRCHGRNTSETCVAAGNLARPRYCLSFFYLGVACMA
jgi:hypothetical protein